jgi:hypothetical protein
MENFNGLLMLIVLGCAYFLPWIIAGARHHHNRTAIAVLNLLTGWTALGWIVAIVWACTVVRHDPVAAA